MQGLLGSLRGKVHVILFCTRCGDFTKWKLVGEGLVCLRCGKTIPSRCLQKYIDEVYPKIFKRFGGV